MIKSTSSIIFSLVDWSITAIGIVVLIFFIAAIWLFNIFFKIEELPERKSKKTILITLGCVVISAGVYPLSLYLASNYEKNVKNNITMICPTYATNYNCQKLGLLSYYIKEATFLLKSDTTSNEEIINHYQKAKLYKDQFTGLLKGKNVISIMVETGDRLMVNKSITPTLYTFLNEGIDCNHNYCNSLTGTSELIALLGNNNLKNNLELDKISTPFSLPHMLINNGYDTIYAHDFGNKHDLYDRLVNIPAVGFNKMYTHSQLFPNIPEWEWNGNYSFDTDFVDAFFNVCQFDDNKPFFANLTTMTMHYPYYQTSKNEQYLSNLKKKYETKLNQIKANKEWVNPLENTTYSQYSDEVDIYMMKCMDFDQALYKLINKLIEKNIYDDTLIVLYGDHNLYYTTKDKKYGLKNIITGIIDTDRHIDLHDTLLTFSNPTLNNKFKELYGSNKFNNFTTLTNIVPTILDLLGINYCPGIYFDSSIFSKNYNINEVCYSIELSMYMNKHYSSETGSDIKSIFDDNGTKNEFITACLNRLTNQYLIDCVYSKNLFSTYNFNNLIQEYIDYN